MSAEASLSTVDEGKGNGWLEGVDAALHRTVRPHASSASPDVPRLDGGGLHVEVAHVLEQGGVEEVDGECGGVRCGGVVEEGEVEGGGVGGRGGRLGGVERGVGRRVGGEEEVE